jgi:hypothetical protein
MCIEVEMSINELKNQIYKLVEESENKYLLEAIFNLISLSDRKKSETFGILWESFNEDQRMLILKSFEQSESNVDLLNHDTVISKIKNEI